MEKGNKIDYVAEFIKDFEDMNFDLAKLLMAELEWEIYKRIWRNFDWYADKKEIFFTEEQKIEIKTKIRQAIWKVIMEDLKDYWL